MATITLNIPNAVLPRVIDGICNQHNYQAEVISTDNNKTEYVPNPETKAVFAKRMIIEYCKSAVKNYEAELVANTARKNALTLIDSEVVLT